MENIQEASECLEENIIKLEENKSEIIEEIIEKAHNIDNVQKQYKFEIIKIEADDLNELSEISLNQIYIRDNLIKNKLLFNCNTHEPQTTNLKIIPNKLKKINNFLLFTYCQVSEETIADVYTNKIVEFNFLIMNISNSNSQIKLSSADLKFKIPNLNFSSLAGYKFFSNFYVIEIKNLLIIFLVIYNYICIIKINIESKEKNFDVIFQKEFINTNLLLFLGTEKISHKNHKFYILMKPVLKFLIFTCKFKNSDKIKITFEEKNAEKFLTYKIEQDKNLDKDKILKIKIVSNTSNLILSKIIVSNNSEIVFFDKPTNKIYLMNKEKMNKIRYLHNSEPAQFEELQNLKNFFIIGDSKPSTIGNTNGSNNHQKNIYLVTDQIIDKNIICVKLWKIKDNHLNNYTNSNNNNLNAALFNTFVPVECEKIQTIYLKSSSLENPFGFYNFTIIDDFNFALCFYEIDEIFIFNLKNSENSPHSNNYIEKIYELSFQELYACMFDYQILSDGILELILYQEDEFLKYEIDMNNGEAMSDFFTKIIKVGSLEKSPSLSFTHPKLNLTESKSNSNETIENNPKAHTISGCEANKIKSEPTLFVTPFISPRKPIDGNRKNLLDDLKKSIGEKIISGVESKLDILINSKLNIFADGLNNKLNDFFSFMKKQTEELDDIKRKNNEAMLQITNLILKNQEIKNTNNSTPAISENINNNPNKVNMVYPYAYSNNLLNLPVYNNLNLNNNFNPYVKMGLGINPINYANTNTQQSIPTSNINRQQNFVNKQLLINNNLNSNNLNNLNTRLSCNNNFNYNNNILYRNIQMNQNYKSELNSGNNHTNHNANNNLISNNNQNFNNNLNMHNKHNLHTIPNNPCEFPTDNKYKEDQIVLENLEKKLFEVKNEESNILNNIINTNLNEGNSNLSLDFNNENNIQEFNYSSDSKIIFIK